MLTIKAPAKINWFLHVSGKRPDGFHEIQSLMQCVSLFDTLTFEHADSLSIDTDADISMEQNLVYKAAQALKQRAGYSGGAVITLDKQIPIAAGLGGGSSDAASALLGLNDLWGLKMGLDELTSIAAGLGSDVPFFVCGGPGIANGRGEVLTPILSGPSAAIALVKPPFGISAGAAYSGVSQYSTVNAAANANNLIAALDNGDNNTLQALMINDLESPIFAEHPELLSIKESLVASGAMASLMSGSGSTLFGVYTDESIAAKSMEHVRGKHGNGLWTTIVRTV